MIFLMGFFVEQFLDYLQFQRKYSNHTCVAYKNDLEEFQKFLADRFEINSFNGVSSDMVRSWVSELIGQNIKPVTVRRKVSTLRTYFKFLQKEKRIDRSPVSNLPALKIASQLPVTIPLESMDTILEELPAENSYQQHLDYLIIALLYGTGCRRSEIIGLQEQNIDLVGRQIKVLGKRNKERIIPITTELNDQIAIFIEIKAGEGIVSERLLVTKKNQILYPGYIYNVVKKYLTLQKMNGKRSPHILRHTYATRLLQNGAELLSVKELLGHSSLASTQMYTHVNIEDLKKIYKKNHPKQ